eukprot:symbB.v1.2.019617.t1/scaffold1614.1/size109413/4
MRRYDFIFCANIVGTLGNALQALKAFLVIAKRMQDRPRGRCGMLVVNLLVAPRKPIEKMVIFESSQGAFTKPLRTPLRQHFDLEEVADASAELRRGSCSGDSCDVSIWSLVQVHSLFLSNVDVPHLWMGPGKDMPKSGDMLTGDLERQMAQAMVPKEPEEKETCAFIYVGHILHREGWWKLKSLNPWAFAAPDRLRADIPTMAGKIGELLQVYQISCANFYVKLLGLTGQDFVNLIHQGAAGSGVNFTAKRLKKRNCRLCMKGNMEMLRRAAAAPLLIAEPDSFWPDLAATRLLERERPVAYIYAELLEKRRWDSWLERFVEPPPNITLRLLDCPWPNQVYRGTCVEPSTENGLNLFGDFSPQQSMMNLMRSAATLGGVWTSSMDIDPAELTRWIAGDVEDEEDDGNDETADIYSEYLEFAEVEERLLHRPRLPQLPPNPRRRRIDFAGLQGQLNQILKGVCVAGKFSVQTSHERSDGTVARATVVVERGPSELLNHMVRVYSLKDRNRARQGDQVWVELRSCALDRAALDRRSRIREGEWNLGEDLPRVITTDAQLPSGATELLPLQAVANAMEAWRLELHPFFS